MIQTFERLENDVREGQVESEEFESCGFCEKKIRRQDAFYSPGNYAYCNEMCYMAFTED